MFCFLDEIWNLMAKLSFQSGLILSIETLVNKGRFYSYKERGHNIDVHQVSKKKSYL